MAYLSYLMRNPVWESQIRDLITTGDLKAFRLRREPFDSKCLAHVCRKLINDNFYQWYPITDKLSKFIKIYYHSMTLRSTRSTDRVCVCQVAKNRQISKNFWTHEKVLKFMKNYELFFISFYKFFRLIEETADSRQNTPQWMADCAEV